ncbi:unnamed protein product [Caenorhabditis auriculariae]|uniref:Uncharacterized protein n=1 Tax=Caenorhabditis auriculariae TaxID=2777116 RepID=A0A8S1HLB4_9PELO|nr:unnamed protein product [Caenorhabditis auriculariae]
MFFIHAGSPPYYRNPAAQPLFRDRKVLLTAALTLPPDSFFCILLYLVYPDSLIPSILFVVNFALVVGALVGINGNLPALVIPVLIWKCILLLFMMFVGCITVDDYQQMPPRIRHGEYSTTSRGTLIFKDLAEQYPTLPFAAVICTLVLAIEARIFFFSWQKMCIANSANRSDPPRRFEKQEPPSYTSCVAPTGADGEPPSYEDALRFAQRPSTSSATQPTIAAPIHGQVRIHVEAPPEKPEKTIDV